MRVRVRACRRRLIREHYLYLVALCAGLGLRMLSLAAVRPALWYNDSFEYVGVALRMQPYPVRPAGYSAFLAMIEPLHSFAVVVVGQHLMGLTSATLLYALLRRWRVAQWLATLSVLPSLLDIHVVELEHIVLSDTLFTLLTVGGFTALLWRERPTWILASGGALLLAAAALTRTVGIPLIVLAGLVLLGRWPGWRSVMAFACCASAPLLAYAIWFDSAHGQFGVNNSDGIFLYSRVMAFADCDRIHPAAKLRVLCDPRAPSQRAPSSVYIWHPSPLDNLPGPPGERFVPERNDPAQSFAIRAILEQPSSYLHVAASDFMRSFSWSRTDFPNAAEVSTYQFSTSPWEITDRVFVPGGSARSDTTAYEQGAADTRLVNPYVRWLIAYQRVGMLPGPALGAALILAAIGALAAFRRDSRFGPCLVLGLVAFALLIVPPLTAQFDYRYVQPAVPFAGAAAATGVAGLLEVIRTRRLRLEELSVGSGVTVRKHRLRP